MKALLVYGSSRGNTRKVVERLPQMLNFDLDIHEVSTIIQPQVLIDASEVLIFLASTWGDGELQVDMENFLVRHTLLLSGKPYAICELGNYYGYDDFEFGAAEIIKHCLDKAGGMELIEPFSMDSLPFKDWGTLDRWCALLNSVVEKMPCTTST